MAKTIQTRCPNCNEEYPIVIEDYPTQQNSEESESDREVTPLNAELVSVDEVSDPPSPYSGSDRSTDIGQCLDADITIDEKTYAFRFWYTPGHEHYGYVAKVQLPSGAKMKNAYKWNSGDYSGELSYTDRGVPKDSDKNWTYLDLDECQRRARLAGLEAESCSEIPESSLKPHRNTIWIGDEERPAMEDGEIAEELLLSLAKGLIVFQTDKF